MKTEPARRFPTITAFAAGILTASTATAQFRLFDDFEGLTPGPIHNVDGWRSVGGENTVVPDPDNPDNLILRVPSSSSSLRKSLLDEGLCVPDGHARTIFMRLRIANKQTFSVGLSYLVNPTEYGDFAPEIGMANSTQNLDLRVWDGDGDMYQRLTSLNPDTWYNLWIFVDSDTNQSAVWLNNRDSRDATPDDRLSAPDGDALFAFRSGSLVDLKTFYIRTSGGDSGVNFGPIYIDDIYLTINDDVDLRNPLALCPADLHPDGVLDLLDVLAFVRAFADMSPIADLAPPYTVFDLDDVQAFVDAFAAGCP
jgi:hypothetical protein